MTQPPSSGSLNQTACHAQAVSLSGLSMKHVRIHVRSQAADHSVHIHGRLLVWRGDDWHTAGVFQLLRREWLELAALCVAAEIEIVNEQAPAIPTEPAASSC